MLEVKLEGLTPETNFLFTQKEKEALSVEIEAKDEEIIEILAFLNDKTNVRELTLSLGEGFFNVHIASKLNILLQHNPHITKLTLVNGNFSAAASAVLAFMLRENRTLIDLTFESNNWHDASCFKAVAKALRVNQSVRTLAFIDLSINFLSWQLPFILKMLEKNTFIETIHLKGFEFDSETASKLGGLEIDSSAVLTSFNVVNCVFPNNTFEDFCDSLIQNPKTLGLNLSETKIYNAGARLLAALLLKNRIQHLDLRDCGIDYRGMNVLIGALANNNSVHSLVLNQVPSRNLAQLAVVLETNSTLQSLRLQDCSEFRNATIAFVHMLRQNGGLEFLSLSGFTDDGAVLLTDALQYNDTLLELEGVEQFPRGFIEIAKGYLECNNQLKKANENSLSVAGSLESNGLAGGFFDKKRHVVKSVEADNHKALTA